METLAAEIYAQSIVRRDQQRPVKETLSVIRSLIEGRQTVAKFTVYYQHSFGSEKQPMHFVETQEEADAYVKDHQPTVPGKFTVEKT